MLSISREIKCIYFYITPVPIGSHPQVPEPSGILTPPGGGQRCREPSGSQRGEITPETLAMPGGQMLLKPYSAQHRPQFSLLRRDPCVTPAEPLCHPKPAVGGGQGGTPRLRVVSPIVRTMWQGVGCCKKPWENPPTKELQGDLRHPPGPQMKDLHGGESK